MLACCFWMLLIRGRELNGRAKSQNEESMNELKRERESVCVRENIQAHYWKIILIYSLLQYWLNQTWYAPSVCLDKLISAQSLWKMWITHYWQMMKYDPKDKSNQSSPSNRNAIFINTYKTHNYSYITYILIYTPQHNTFDWIVQIYACLHH